MQSVGQVQLSLSLSNYAGSFSPDSVGFKYPLGTMNDIIGSVHGGMEDWAYAASWDKELVNVCTPTSFGGYDASKTMYDNATLRAFNILIETSNNKTPSVDSLGTDEGLFDEMPGDGNGHISRNIRLATMMIDTVEPYISIVVANDHILTDTIPMMPKKADTCLETHIINIPSNTSSVEIFWTVGGSFRIDETRLAYGVWNIDFDFSMDCFSQVNDIYSLFTNSTSITESQNGRSRWHEEGPFPDAKESSLHEIVGKTIPYGAIFSEKIDLSRFKSGDKVAVLPFAKVDQHWKSQPSPHTPEVSPQSHSVNIRTNPSWRFESAGKVVQGRLYWRGVPITLEIK